MKISLAAVISLSLATSAFGKDIPKGYTIPASTFSPDQRYGVAVPMVDKLLDHETFSDIADKLVEIKSGRVVAEIQGDEGWDRALNFRQLAPTHWSADGTVLIWEVSGKWCPTALTVLKIALGKVPWQTDVLHVAQQAIVAHTKEAAPKKFAAAKKANAGNGSAFPEGFTVDVKITGPTAFPLHIEVVLNSDPKETGRIPKLESVLHGVLDDNGKFRVTSFDLIPNSSGQSNE